MARNFQFLNFAVQPNALTKTFFDSLIDSLDEFANRKSVV